MIRLPLTAAALVSTLALSLPAAADGTATAQYLSGRLTVEVSGPSIAIQLRLPMTRATVETKAKQDFTQDEVIARLKAADKLFGFPEAAKCQVESANAFAVDSQGKITKNDGNMQAMYRFSCDAAGAKSLDRIKIKLFEGLPGLDSLKLQISSDKGDRNVEVTAANSDVAL
ncbi:MAG: DUF2796 domain-containing protein [Burkholderiales bacterium]